MMERAKELYNQINEVMQKINIKEDVAFLEFVSNNYLITFIYSEFEHEINKIIFSNIKTDRELTNKYLKKVSDKHQKFHRGLKISDINGLFNNLDIKVDIGARLGDNKNTYDNFINSRHAISHDSSGINTAIKIKDVINSVEKVLEIVDNELRNKNF